MLKKTEAIVIRSTNYGEKTKILTLFSREYGKFGLMAKGARSPKSRLAAVSQLFTYAHYVFYGRSGMPVLNQGDIIESFRDIGQDLTKTSYAAYIVELLDKLTPEFETNPFLFEGLYQTLNAVSEGKDPEILTRIFEIKMLQASGLRPQLDVCTQCKRTEGPFLFSVGEGGLLCESCRHQDPYAFAVSEAAAKLLRVFQHVAIERLGDIQVKKETKDQLKTVMYRFFDEYTGYRFKSRRFLDQLENML